MGCRCRCRPHFEGGANESSEVVETEKVEGRLVFSGRSCWPWYTETLGLLSLINSGVRELELDWTHGPAH